MLMLMSPETRVPQTHPLRAIKKMADEALRKLSPVFDRMYAQGGRPSIPPERLLKSMLLMAFYSVRSERQFCEQLDYNLVFRWFLDMDMVEQSFHPSVFSHNRDRLIIHDVAGELLRAIVEEARQARLMSSDHFTVDGTLIESWASLKSFKKKHDDERPPDDPGNPTVDFHGEKRSNETHESTTDPDAKLARTCRWTSPTATPSAATRWRCSTTTSPASDASRSPATRATTRATSSKTAASATSRPTSRRTSPSSEGRTSTAGRPGTPATRSVGNLRKTRFIGLGANQVAAYVLASAYNLLRIAKLLEAA